MRITHMLAHDKILAVWFGAASIVLNPIIIVSFNIRCAGARSASNIENPFGMWSKLNLRRQTIRFCVLWGLICALRLVTDLLPIDAHIANKQQQCSYICIYIVYCINCASTHLIGWDYMCADICVNVPNQMRRIRCIRDGTYIIVCLMLWSSVLISRNGTFNFWIQLWIMLSS